MALTYYFEFIVFYLTCPLVHLKPYKLMQFLSNSNWYCLIWEQHAYVWEKGKPKFCLSGGGENDVEKYAWLHLGLGRGKKPKCHLSWIKFWNNSSVLSKSVQINWKYQIRNIR